MSVPFPVSAVPMVKLLLLINLTPVTVMFGIVKDPESAVSVWSLVMNVWTPVPALKIPVPKSVIPLLNVAGEFPVLFQVAPADTVTRPLRFSTPAALLMTMLPLDPPPTVVVPVTVSGNPATAKVVPSPMERLPPIVKPTTVVAVAVPLRVRLPPIPMVPVANVLAPVPKRLRLL